MLTVCFTAVYDSHNGRIDIIPPKYKNIYCKELIIAQCAKDHLIALSQTENKILISIDSIHGKLCFLFQLTQAHTYVDV